MIAYATSKRGRGGPDIGRVLGEASAEHAAGRLPQAAALFERGFAIEIEEAFTAMWETAVARAARRK